MEHHPNMSDGLAMMWKDVINHEQVKNIIHLYS